ncbi:P-loop containing nucleoside triphosphate hydrolase protein [Umbelopsis sp. AD052]|nr:P-loop containing nucleoside triphosphate hydrolase protein [Umbelopsis sp. AD052]
MSTFFQNARVASANNGQLPPEAQPWVEKYRPKSMNEIASQEQAVQVLKKALTSNNLPHLLFYGPPGTGKTSTILALARELFGPELIRSRVLELNASDERGIQIVREKVKNFARTTVTATVDDYPCPPYKIIILDEADSMTTDAQSALRRTMETYSKTTRFCLVCNYVSRIIEPLTSRCAKFRFKPLPIEKLKERIAMVCEQEGVQIEPEATNTLIKASNGDLRKAIMFLQSGAKLHAGEKIVASSINEMAGIVPPEVVSSLTAAWYSTEYQEISKIVDEVMNAGFSAEQILSQMHDHLVTDGELSAYKKAKISLVLGEVDLCLINGADEHLQILNLMLKAADIVTH